MYIYICAQWRPLQFSFYCTACEFVKVVVTRIFIRWIHHTRRWSLQKLFQPQHPDLGEVGRDSNANHGRWCTKHRHALPTLMLRLGLLCTVKAAAIFFLLHGLWVCQGCGHPNFYQVDPPHPQVVPSETFSTTTSHQSSRKGRRGTNRPTCC